MKKQSIGKYSSMIVEHFDMLAADELALPLTNAINSSIRNYRFPNNGKRAAVCSLDKGEANRTVERNFRPVSILNVFSKIYEKILKNQLIPYLDETLSLFIAAYRKSYGTGPILKLVTLRENRIFANNRFPVSCKVI